MAKSGKDGCSRLHLWLLPFPLEGTVVPTWGNRRSHLRKSSFLLVETAVPIGRNCRSRLWRREFGEKSFVIVSQNRYSD